MSYCARADIELLFGADNVEAWADVDNDGNATTITNRITQAIAVADATIDAALRKTIHHIPIVDKDGNVPTLIADLSVRLAAVWLGEARVTEDQSMQGRPSIDPTLMWHRRYVRLMLEWLRKSEYSIDVEKG